MSLLSWLDARQPAMPEPLQAAVRSAIEDADAGGTVSAATVPDELAEVAVHALGRVLRGPDDRDLASALLAADALMTYACEAAAEAGPETLDRVTARLGPDRLASLLEEGS